MSLWNGVCRQNCDDSQRKNKIIWRPFGGRNNKEKRQWKELTNLKNVKEAKYTVSAQEWRPPVVVARLLAVATRAVTLFPRNRGVKWSLFTDWKKTTSTTTYTNIPKALQTTTSFCFTPKVTWNKPNSDFPLAKNLGMQYREIVFADKWKPRYRV